MRTALLLIIGFAITADGMASGFGLLAFYQANNPFAVIVVFAAGFLVTGYVTITGRVWVKDSPLLLKALWVVAVVIDVYTTYVAIVFYVLLRRPWTEQPNIETIPSFLGLFGSGLNQFMQPLLVILLPILLSGTTMISHYVFEREK